MKKIILRIVVGLFIIAIIINFMIGYYLYDLAIERNVKDFLNGNQDLQVSAQAMEEFTQGDWRDWVKAQDFKEWKMKSYDGIALQGYFLPAKEPTNKTVVFAHGYLGRASDMGLFGQYYVEELGYNMFTADMRGHGESGGDYIGFGWHDRLDLIDWVKRVVDELGDDTEIVLHGLSMGAATVLMASGEEFPDNVKAIVADSPYTSVNDLFAYQLDRMFKLPEFPVLPTTGLITNIKAGYNIKEASALEQVKKAEVPILYIHGGSDTFVPTSMTKELLKNTKSEAELMIVDGANHGESIILERDKYLDTLTRFLDKYVY
ncbi:alpha/beta hydrolase [Oceanobacillus caeni]|uniref:alpha/beta hydrolase n=1 Tax=Bacillaceae TaxID=186817 RepID=UPI000621EF31|nr:MULTISPECIES: alpha/beta hydrolase [Bacillaceae]KKE79132.1 alpha/beta hydrolase [Bacilli bacterium VT-13-104]PZD87617.1 alpha/beta hydrolase [Bacilli bacterium]MCR1836112.1 alpha/beta hydrolase [Oceanobacillus caeni]MED4475708.1 alpha/beta hydrolase [Oceanobacillus caeni]PZD90655.1 alpha/beta hydrolase [Bacilli bacterium]